jgi:hypothetical protein
MTPKEFNSLYNDLKEDTIKVERLIGKYLLVFINYI